MTLDIVTGRPPEWTSQALCPQVSLDAWHPETGERGTEAKRICARCPVINECRNLCIQLGETEGIWAGEAASTIQRQHGLGRKERPIEHGTDGGYQAHRRRKEDPCDDCKAGHALSRALRIQRREAA
jgi:hypothetical protein